MTDSITRAEFEELREQLAEALRLTGCTIAARGQTGVIEVGRVSLRIGG